MKTLKRGLLLSAAGLAIVANAKAADLPVKAAPVEYVKVCSLYGAGFFYIPGTDTCLKIGGFGPNTCTACQMSAATICPRPPHRKRG
jgi:hypothetical protein